MMKNKHITIINQYIGSPYHGMEYRHYYLAKNLIAHGYMVTLVSGSYSHLFTTLPEVQKSIEKQKIDGIDYLWVKLPKYKSSKSIGRIWNMVFFLWKLHFLKQIEPSHIIVSSPSIFPTAIGRSLARKFNTKFLFEVRDIWPLTLIELSNLSTQNPIIQIMKRYEKIGYRDADKVISLLPNAKTYYAKRGMPLENFIYLPNGIEETATNPILLSADILAQIPKDKFIVAYTGTVGIANNLDYMIDVAFSLREMDDLHFIILGNGGEKQRLQSRVDDAGLENISFLKAIDKEMIHGFLSQIDVAFISLLPEKLFKFGVSPNKAFDYMYAKKPIIWAIEAGNDLVKEAECGFSVALDNVEGLKESILKLKSLTEHEREQLGENGYNFVIANHSYKTLAQKLINVIEE